MSDIDPSDELADLAFQALDHGIDSVREGGPLIPFAMTEDANGQCALTRFATNTLEEGEAAARDFARAATDAVRVAIAYDGFLTIDGEKTDAILVEAQDRSEPSSAIFAQRYRPRGKLRRFQTVGNAALIGSGSLTA